MAGQNITEDLPLNIGNPGTSGFWTNNAEDYDVAFGGIPFLLAPTDTNPYQRETAPYRKEQFDNSKEPGEQSLTGWWIRSQSSFHGGTGINFFDPTSGESTGYRFHDSKGVDVWTKGQVSLLHDVTAGHITTGPITNTVANGMRPNQHIRSIQWNNTQGYLLHDEYDVDKIDGNGTETHFVNYNAGTNDKVYAICDDGVYAYWVTNDAAGGAGKLQIWKKPLSEDYTVTTITSPIITSTSITVVNATMEYVKDRIVACINNAVYEIAPNASSLPSPVYTNPNTSYVYTSITASGPAIYTTGFSGILSTIQKYTLGTNGSMPTLTQASVAAELPPGEIVHKIYFYLGLMAIGTSKGVRIAEVSDQDGSIAYGPLTIQTSLQPCYDFCGGDRFIWCATGVGEDAGITRIDLSQIIEGEPLRFAYANDLSMAQAQWRPTTGVCFLGNTARLAFTTGALTADTAVTNKSKTSDVITLTTSSAHGLSVGDSIWVEGVDAVGGSAFNSTTTAFTIISVPTTTTLTYLYSTTGQANVASTAVSTSAAKVNKPGLNYVEMATQLTSSGYLTTGAIRYGTLEPKNFKFVRGRGDFTNGAMDIQTIEPSGDIYNVITYNASIGTPEAATTEPEGPQEYESYKFTLSRSASDTSLGPIFKGFQAKALPATKRQRLIQYPVWCYDVEKDRNNVQTGYEGRAWERIQILEALEAAGDIINVQDFTTSERVQAIIERIDFSRKTPPSGEFTGFGGLLLVTVRTVL